MLNVKNLQQAIEVINLKHTDLAGEEKLEQLVKRKYYEQALEVHPDRNGSNENFQHLLSAYQLLLRAVQENKKLITDLIQKKGIHEFQTSENTNSTEYLLYKKAVQDYSLAIEEYFEKVKKVNLNPEDPDYLRLCLRIMQTKKELFEVIKLNPAGIWVSDCIDKISRINVWLKK